MCAEERDAILTSLSARCCALVSGQKSRRGPSSVPHSQLKLDDAGSIVADGPLDRSGVIQVAEFLGPFTESV
jgi:hypothetical protein